MDRLRLAVSHCLLVLWCGLLIGCGATGAPDPAEDVKQLQGTWTLDSTISNGVPQMADLQWLVEGDHYTIRLDGRPHVDPHYFKLDPSKRQIDVLHRDVPNGASGGTLKGIYEIKGDRLSVCFDQTGREYPTSFDSKPGSRRVLYQFHRAGT